MVKSEGIFRHFGLTVFCMALFAGAFFARDAFASASAGTGTPTGGVTGNCSGQAGCIDGSGWVYYRFDSVHSATVAGVSITECSGYNGFWFNHYKLAGSQGNINAGVNGKMTGARLSGETLANNGGSYFNGGQAYTYGLWNVSYSGASPDFSQGILGSYSEVYNRYVANGGDESRMTSTNPATGMIYFCYNEGDGAPTYDPDPDPVITTANFTGSVSIYPDASGDFDGPTIEGGRYVYTAKTPGTYSFSTAYHFRRTDVNSPANADVQLHADCNSGYSACTNEIIVQEVPYGSGSYTVPDIAYPLVYPWTGLVRSTNLTLSYDAPDQTICGYMKTDNSRYSDGIFQNWVTGNTASNCIIVRSPSRPPDIVQDIDYTGATAGDINWVDADLSVSKSGASSTGIMTSRDGSTHNYQLQFVHTITRANSTLLDGSGNLVVSCSGATKPASSYTIYEQKDGGAWYVKKTSSACKDNNGEQDVIVSATNISLKSNSGAYVKYCQKLKYVKRLSYNLGIDISSSASYSPGTPVQSEAETSAVCLALGAPKREDTVLGDRNRIASLGGEIDRPHISATGAVAVGGDNTNLSATAFNIEVSFDHNIWRHDEGYNESFICGSVANPSMDNPCFSNINGQVRDNPDFDITISPESDGEIRADDGTTVLATRSQVSPCSFNSSVVTATDGTGSSDVSTGTHTTADCSIKESLNGGSGAYGLLAGETKYICQGTLFNPSRYIMRYKDIGTRDTYSAGLAPSDIVALSDGAFTYQYTRLESTYAEPDNSSFFVQEPKTCVKVTRDWNYLVTDVMPQGGSASGKAKTSEETVQPKFTLHLDRADTDKEYVTDANLEVDVISFAVPEGATNLSAITNGLANPGPAGVNGKGYCDALSSSLGVNVTNCALSGGTLGSLSGATGKSVYNKNASGSYEYTNFYTPDPIAIPSDVPVGAKFCVALAIRRASSADANYSLISRAHCANVSKHPVLSVWGGSVQTNGGITTIMSDSGENHFGSWADFALIARRDIENMSSGAGIASGFTGNNRVVCSLSKLTIANNRCDYDPETNLLGDSGIARYDRFFESLKNRYIDGYREGEDTGINVIPSDNSIIINSDFWREWGFGGASTGPSTTVPIIIYSKGDIIIRQSFQLTAITARNALIPQIILLAEGDIKIYEDVTTIDAWLIAQGKVDTCAYSESGLEVKIGTPTASETNRVGLSAKNCNKPLRINGPIVASRADFKRTGGADLATPGGITETAETVNFSAAPLIYTAGESSRNGEPQITYIKSLAPRY